MKISVCWINFVVKNYEMKVEEETIEQIRKFIMQGKSIEAFRLIRLNLRNINKIKDLDVLEATLNDINKKKRIGALSTDEELRLNAKLNESLISFVNELISQKKEIIIEETSSVWNISKTIILITLLLIIICFVLIKVNGFGPSFLNSEFSSSDSVAKDTIDFPFRNAPTNNNTMAASPSKANIDFIVGSYSGEIRSEFDTISASFIIKKEEDNRILIIENGGLKYYGEVQNENTITVINIPYQKVNSASTVVGKKIKVDNNNMNKIVYSYLMTTSGKEMIYSIYINI